MTTYLPRALLLAIVLAAVACASPRAARAQMFPPPPAPPPAAPEADADVQQRLTRLEGELADVKRPMNLWWGSWIGMLGALGVGQLALAATADPQTRLEEGHRARLYLSSGLSFAGLALMLRPRPGRVASRRLSRVPEATAEQRRAKLRAAETFLRDSAVSAHRIRGIWSHLLVGAVGLSAGLGFGLAYGDIWLAVMAGGGPALIAELRIWSHPYRKQRYWKAYAQDPSGPSSITLVPVALERGAGFALHSRF